jgi:transmembrane sensor
MSDFSHTPDTKIIESEAAAWLAQLDGDNMSVQDLAAFKDWMRRSPRHQLEIRELAEVWGELNTLTDLIEPIAEASSAERKILKQQKNKFLPGWTTVLTACVAVAFIGFSALHMLNTGTEQRQPTLIATSIGQQQTSILPDGSSVILNTNSKIEVDYSASVRKIRLLYGEAVFDVTADKKRPFVVYADNGVVRAVGTIFSVRIDNEAVNVTVSEGVVELSSITQSTISEKAPSVAAAGFIKAGHMAVLENQRTLIAPLSIEKINAALSWQDGLLTISGEPLEQVVAEISRYTTLKISISDPKIRNMRIGGVFPTGDMDALFEALEIGFGVVSTQVSSDEVVLSSASQQ